jgi:uncharacterized repeat protein (TIGR03803 family)
MTMVRGTFGSGRPIAVAAGLVLALVTASHARAAASKQRPQPFSHPPSVPLPSPTRPAFDPHVMISGLELLHTFADGHWNNGFDIGMDLSGHIYGGTQGPAQPGAPGGTGGIYELSPPAAGSTAWNFRYLTTLPPGPAGTKPGPIGVDPHGNVWGTTQDGGTHHAGTLFHMDASRQVKLLENLPLPGTGGFNAMFVDAAGDLFAVSASDAQEQLNGQQLRQVSTLMGQMPNSIVLAADGNLYGTTIFGACTGDPNANGTVFRIRPGQSAECLGDFGYDPNGCPNRLVPMPDGSLYGTTSGSAEGNHGLVFRWSSATGIRNIHSFSNADGYSSYSGMVPGPDGLLYGFTTFGGAGNGTIFSIHPSSNAYKVLYTFNVATDGGSPCTTPIIRDGYLYGATGFAVFRFHLPK